MWCVECYRINGKGIEDAGYVYNGKSLCNLHLWDELKKPETTKALAVADKPTVSRGSRLPGKDTGGWMPQQATIDQIKDEFPWATSEQIAAEHRSFCDWAYSSASRNAVKKDWEGTWRNWMRRELKKPQSHRRNNDDKIRELMEMDVDAPATE